MPLILIETYRKFVPMVLVIFRPIIRKFTMQPIAIKEVSPEESSVYARDSSVQTLVPKFTKILYV